MDKKQDLADFIRAVMNEKNLSTYDVQKRSRNAITAATVTKILNREIKSSGVDTLVGLAVGLGVGVEELLNIVRGVSARPTRYEIYAERFDAHDLEDTEWQLLEAYFNDHVERLKAFKEEMKQRQAEAMRAPVVARIEPGNRPELTKADAQRMIDAADIGEIEQALMDARSLNDDRLGELIGRRSNQGDAHTERESADHSASYPQSRCGWLYDLYRRTRCLQ